MITRIAKILTMAVVCFPMIAFGNGPAVVSFGIAEAQADVNVYRALGRKNATYAKVNDDQFRVDDDGLSTFEAAEFTVTNKQCKLVFVIKDVESKPEQDTEGTIEGMEGYKGIYTPQHGGEGHWSIINSDKTKEEMQADFTTYALSGGNISQNAGYTGGSACQCQTPAAAN